MSKRSFLYRADGSTIYVTHLKAVSGPEEHVLCKIEKHQTWSWAAYIVQLLNMAEEMKESGLTAEQIAGLARIYNATREDNDPNSN